MLKLFRRHTTNCPHQEKGRGSGSVVARCGRKALWTALGFERALTLPIGNWHPKSS